MRAGKLLFSILRTRRDAKIKVNSLMLVIWHCLKIFSQRNLPFLLLMPGSNSPVYETKESCLIILLIPFKLPLCFPHWVCSFHSIVYSSLLDCDQTDRFLLLLLLLPENLGSVTGNVWFVNSDMVQISVCSNICCAHISRCHALLCEGLEGSEDWVSSRTQTV